ncbi:hypothetical protein Deipr_0015 [Deinococcus proteolyticus MRP]|uniref:Peptidase C39-like domain-containing protein n=1 Tax=Deinococcus proteolyticus (strain ATCC 35074 / DSM 20540 / JCM 6276 / NBRC 101906 / NCIMB 13154 / VKM Ac-1939 / CCM 2703 / MRP) TaxID=693977 RepID=F0RIT5_DEIPM|nr:hypothetical protein [Deinococcus proteolyticus]ADY25194.1 hypothetical protein Deipr_0015 [Deinococcus proteolyticus MRP]
MSYTESGNQLWHPFPLPLPSDGGQCQWQGGYVGCGPQTAAVLLGWQARRLGLSLPEPERDALAARLAPQLGAWVVPFSGRQRAVQPWSWLLGLSRVLEREGLPLRARGHWGYRPDTRARLAHNWKQGIPTVGFEFSPRTQHYGLLSAYAGTAHGLEGQLVAPLVGKPTLHLQPRLGLGGVFWLEEA